jgi:two-component system NtrC family sensor kinase
MRAADVSLQRRLTRDFTIAVLVPASITTAVGVGLIRSLVLAQAQAHVNANLAAASAIYDSALERQKDALRIHATRRVIYQALAAGDTTDLAAEMERVRRAEGLDLLGLCDARGRVVISARNPQRAGDVARQAVIWQVLRSWAPAAGTALIDADLLAREAPALAERARMEVRPTPRARPSGMPVVSGGMVLEAAAPVVTPDGRQHGVLYGAVLLNRDEQLVDRIRETVFRGQTYAGRDVGTATIFQDDVRIATNVRDADGSRAVATRASAEVAAQVLERGGTWHDRAFVVSDWYLAAYQPIDDLAGRTIGMLYVGVLERPYTDMLWRSLFLFLGIAALGIALVNWVAIRAARRISGPIDAIAGAARRVAQGDYGPRLPIASSDELGRLTADFNTMTEELASTHQQLRDWAATLERKVEERTSQLSAAQAHLAQAAKLAAIGKLAAGVAHEINNPLTGILTNSSLMLEDLPPGDARREDLQTIVDETLRCRRIVKGLLDFARQTRPQKASLAVNQAVEDVLALVRNQAGFRNIAVSLDLDPALPAVMADADQIRQVVLNIVLNAADAMAGAGQLRVSSRFDAARGEVVLAFSDSGPGIPAEIRDRLFEPFFSTKETGTGLGLSIAYGILQQHRGTIGVDCPPGGGTTVRVTLPLNGSQAHDEPARA